MITLLLLLLHILNTNWHATPLLSTSELNGSIITFAPLQTQSKIPHSHHLHGSDKAILYNLRVRNQRTQQQYIQEQTNPGITLIGSEHAGIAFNIARVWQGVD